MPIWLPLLAQYARILVRFIYLYNYALRFCNNVKTRLTFEFPVVLFLLLVELVLEARDFRLVLGERVREGLDLVVRRGA